MIEVRNIAKAFGAIRAVQDISCTIQRGEVVGLLGPNGAGKSTTMRMMTGYLQPDAGVVRIGGIDVATDPLGARALIGYLPESAPLYHDMEVTDFLDYIAALRKLAAPVRRERIREMVELCGLKSVVGRPIAELSKGYRQRVGLAAAMLPHPPVLILDEPTTGLDPNQIQEIRDVIRNIGRERTVVLSTHIMQEVEAVCSRALIIHRGQLAGEGSLAELVNQQSGQVRFAMLVNAAEGMLRERARQFNQGSLVTCRRLDGEWHEAVFTAHGGVAGEDLFQWVVANGWRLRELRREAVSLEDVFRELTRQ
ncbi:MAG: ATP-binding cassette domain-containing protein [Deltaproteobacteria bacterium]|nr:ATP-binding cassette domain-containing protein [Deltaproteobacteria bacterium]